MLVLHQKRCFCFASDLFSLEAAQFTASLPSPPGVHCIGVLSGSRPVVAKVLGFFKHIGSRQTEYLVMKPDINRLLNTYVQNGLKGFKMEGVSMLKLFLGDGM